MLWLLTGLPSAQADGLDLGVGLRNSLYEESAVDGGRLIARWSQAAWSVEAQLYATPVTERVTDLDTVLVVLLNKTGAEYQRTIGVDRATAGVLLSHRLVPPAEPISCGPALYLGGEIGQQALYTLSYDPDSLVDAAKAGTRLVGGPVGGVGLELSVERFSARFSVLDRVRRIDGEVSQLPTLTLDAMWRL